MLVRKANSSDFALLWWCSVTLKQFRKFEDTADALEAATALNAGKMSDSLKKFLKSAVKGEKLAVFDHKLASSISKKLEIECIADSTVAEFMRCIRSQLSNLLSGSLPQAQLNQMTLGLSHSLSRYKLKFSPEKVDTMIVQAVCTSKSLPSTQSCLVSEEDAFKITFADTLSLIVLTKSVIHPIFSMFFGPPSLVACGFDSSLSNAASHRPLPLSTSSSHQHQLPLPHEHIKIALLDDLDKDLNIYTMRAREWYGYHFPELIKVVPDNLTFCRAVRAIGHRHDLQLEALTDLLEEDIAQRVVLACNTSMGTAVSDEDMLRIKALVDQVIDLTEARERLWDYIKNRMRAYVHFTFKACNHSF